MNTHGTLDATVWNQPHQYAIAEGFQACLVHASCLLNAAIGQLLSYDHTKANVSAAANQVVKTIAQPPRRAWLHCPPIARRCQPRARRVQARSKTSHNRRQLLRVYSMTAMRRDLKAITLDLDDTLWPSGPALAAAEEHLHVWLEENAPAVAAA